MSRVSLSTLLDRSTRNMGSGINEVVKETALEVIKRAYKEGINVQISDGYRSYTEQDRLYAQGRTSKGSIVTNARGGYSNHNFGLAVDYFLTSEDGNKAIWEVNAKWKRVAVIAKSLGFSWGGDWSSFRDYPHLEMTGGLSTAQLRNGKRPSLGSKTSKKRTLKLKSPMMNGSDVKRYQQALASKYFYPDKKAKNKGIDGWFGKDTQNATVRFQKMNGLVPDGIAGEKTFAKLGL